MMLNNGKPLILIVDDITENLQVLVNFLKNDIYQISISTNGKHALNSINIKKPDLILLDVMMPDLSGFEVCRILKKDKKTKDIPVIFLTSRNQKEDVVEGLKIGAVDYIVKPFKKDELLVRVNNHLKLKIAQDRINYDINHIKKLNQELNKLNQTKDKMLSIIAHELRNPIGNFKVFLDLITRKNSNMSEDKKAYILDLMKDSANSTYNLLENLLAWARNQQGKFSFNPKEIKPKKITDDIISLFSTNIENKNLKIENKIDENVVIFADENMLQMIFRNLILNAIKFSFEESKIKIYAKENSKFISFFVEDSGLGIKKEDVYKMFSHNFYSTLGTKNEKGSGLGLSLCKDFVERHKGSINVESEENKKTIFSFSLPN